MGGLVDVAEDELALAPGVGCSDNASDFLARQNFLDDIELITALLTPSMMHF